MKKKDRCAKRKKEIYNLSQRIQKYDKIMRTKTDSTGL